jgi:NAD(P)-dependent dehydrogenase (short-subunit alcohol dehydrogenase family)
MRETYSEEALRDLLREAAENLLNAAAKAGIAMLRRHAAIEVGPHGVRVNVPAPATIWPA